MNGKGKREELYRALALFVGRFEHVFESDWEYTKNCLKAPETFIDSDADFLTPAQFDEGNNWCSREALLESYRDLVEVMLREGVIPVLDEEEFDSLG